MTGKAPYGPDAYENQQYWREQAKAETERRGFKEGELQMLWRGSGCFARKYDMGEVVAAICDALTREGQTAWPGDGTSCVEQMIRLQWERAERAEAALAWIEKHSRFDSGGYRYFEWPELEESESSLSKVLKVAMENRG